MKKVAFVRPFARALFNVAKDQKAFAAVRSDLLVLRELNDKAGDFGELLITPLINKETKKAIISKTMSDKIAPITLGFLEAVIDKHAGIYLNRIIVEFLVMLDKEEGKVEARVISAVTIKDDILDALKQRLTVLAKREVTLNTFIDPGIKGGIIVKMGERVIDGSVRTHLAKLRESLIQG